MKVRGVRISQRQYRLLLWQYRNCEDIQFDVRGKLREELKRYRAGREKHRAVFRALAEQYPVERNEN